MKTSTSQQFRQILEQFDFREPGQLFLNGTETPIEYVHVPEARLSNLVDILTNILYSDFYCLGTHPEDFADPAPAFDAEEPAIFSGQLSAANQTTGGLDHGWEMESPARGGAAYLSKGNYRRVVPAGDYLREEPGNGKQPYGMKASIYRRKESQPIQDVFYYAFGETSGEEATPGIVRLYFNISATSSPAFLNWLSGHFNQYQIPFQYKCLNHPALYSRADAGVLYLSKNYANFALGILHRYYHEYKKMLKTSVPLFTLALAPGMAFAESPPFERESFGMSRCRAFAVGMAAALDKKAPQAQWLEEILASLRSQQFDPERLYLDPGTHYPYFFPAFK